MYPLTDSKTMMRLRQVLFYAFALVYIIACPLLILNALGYIFVTGSNPSIVRSGVIHLVTVPPGANVYLQDELYPEKTPVTISDLPPGYYYVRISMEGKRSWSGFIPVRAKQATVFKRIQLRSISEKGEDDAV